MQVVDLPPRSGLQWIGQAWSLFRAQPGGWIALMSVWLMFSLALFALVPLVGPPVCVLMQPGLFAGMVIAARDQEQEKRVGPGHLFAGFGENGRALVTIGSVALLAEALVTWAISALGFPRVPLGENGLPDMRGLVAALQLGDWALLAGGMLAITLVKGVLWFSTALLALHPMRPVEAIRWSGYALVANFGSMLFLLFGMTILLLAAWLPLMLGLLLWMPIYALVHYTSFKAVFR